MSVEIQNSEERLRIKKIENDSTSNDSLQVFFSNRNIKAILSDFFKDIDLDLNIITYGNNEKKEEQWFMQHTKLAKKLRIDLNKFKSRDSQEKIHIIGIKDAENQIISASIIRCYLKKKRTSCSRPTIEYIF